MLCYLDITFCASPDCKCGRKLTDEIREAAAEWWGGPDAPIATSYFCGGDPNKIQDSPELPRHDNEEIDR